MGEGFAIAAASWILALAFLIFFLLVYLPVMHREAKFLREKFGEAYDQYAAHTSLFIPMLGSKSKAGAESGPTKQFRWQLYRKNHEYEAALGYIAGLVFLAVKLRLR
jgi:hypothetical protein